MKKLSQPRGLKGPRKVSRSSVEVIGLNKSKIISMGKSKAQIKALGRGKVKRI